MTHDADYYISAIDDRCDRLPSEGLLLAMDEFNRREWFQCHETLEALWLGTKGEIRDFYQGVLQVAVALHHWSNGNFGGATGLLRGGALLLRRVAPVCQKVDVTALVTCADLLREELTRLGSERMGEVDEDLLPKMRLVG